MGKRKFKLTDAERKELLRTYRACQEAATRTRYQAVRSYGEGYPEKEIEQITGCNRTSLMEWCRAYRADPSQGLVDKRVGGNRAKLRRLQIEEIQNTLHQYIRPRNDWVEKPALPMGNFGRWRIWFWWFESDMALHTKAGLRTAAYCGFVAFATRRLRRSSSLGVSCFPGWR